MVCVSLSSTVFSVTYRSWNSMSLKSTSRVSRGSRARFFPRSHLNKEQWSLWNSPRAGSVLAGLWDGWWLWLRLMLLHVRAVVLFPFQCRDQTREKMRLLLGSPFNNSAHLHDNTWLCPGNLPPSPAHILAAGNASTVFAALVVCPWMSFSCFQGFLDIAAVG